MPRFGSRTFTPAPRYPAPRRGRGANLAGAALGALLLSCATQPAATPPPAVLSPVPPAAAVRRDGDLAFAELDVMTFNVKGLPPPLRADAAWAMQTIAMKLRAMQAAGTAPDIVLIQEGFLDETRLIGQLGGYPFAASGPGAADTAAAYPALRDEMLEAGSRLVKGETLGPLVGSGLHVYSRHPITMARPMAYGRNACAGYDCLANKGALLVSVRLPGVPEDVQIFTTHMNAQKAAGVSRERSALAHRLQMMKLGAFLRDEARADLAVIFGGDFNTKNSPPRRTVAERELAGYAPTHLACAAMGEDCAMALPAEDGVHWLEARDLQGYRSGARITVRPLGIAHAFAEPVDGRTLSDHLAVRARYRLSWRPAAILARAQ